MRVLDRLLPALFVALVSLPAAAQEPTALDREIRAAYASVEEARNAMAGEMEEEDRVKRMERYREVCMNFVNKFRDREEGAVVGHFDLARAWIDLQDTARAAGHLERFLAAAPKHADAPRARLFLGDCYRSTSRLEEAVALYRAFLAESEDAELKPFAALGLATSLYLDLRFDEAVGAYRDVIKSYPEHQVGADAAFQLTDALAAAGRYAEALAHIDALLEEAKEAPELVERRKTVALLGRPAPELEGVERWIGRDATALERHRGRAVVLCFFMNNNVPSTMMLQYLSDLRKELEGRPVTVWGVTKAYKAGAHPDWGYDDEARWLARYRSNPRFVLQRELRKTPSDDAEERQIWAELEKPITVPIALTRGFENHQAYGVRGVPCVVLIDKKGMIRLVEQGGQPVGGFQSRLIDRVLRSLAAE